MKHLDFSKRFSENKKHSFVFLAIIVIIILTISSFLKNTQKTTNSLENKIKTNKKEEAKQQKTSRLNKEKRKSKKKHEFSYVKKRKTSKLIDSLILKQIFENFSNKRFLKQEFQKFSTCYQSIELFLINLDLYKNNLYKVEKDFLVIFNNLKIIYDIFKNEKLKLEIFQKINFCDSKGSIPPYKNKSINAFIKTFEQNANFENIQEEQIQDFLTFIKHQKKLEHFREFLIKLREKLFNKKEEIKQYDPEQEEMKNKRIEVSRELQEVLLKKE